jgi:hypothetical protein
VLARESELRRLSFAEIQQRATAGYLRGATYFEVNEAAAGGVSADCRYIDTQRLASNECEGTVEQVCVIELPIAWLAVMPMALVPTNRSLFVTNKQVRGWLYHKVGLNDLFDGRGFTKLADGSSGVPECLIVNRRIEEFGDAFAWVDLNLEM